MFVKQPFDQNTRASAVADSGTRLYIKSHSDAPNRVKRMPASARKYCPVMVQVHSRWMLLSLRIRYSMSSPLRPRVLCSPGDAAVQRMKRQPSNEVTRMVSQEVM